METDELKNDCQNQEEHRPFAGKIKKPLIPWDFHESILFIIWGWILFYDYFRFYLVKKMSFSYDFNRILEYSSVILVIAGILFTGYYLYNKREILKTEKGKSLLTVWISLLTGMVMINLIQMNVVHQIVFELQHAVYMLITAFAIVMTGRIIRNPLTLIGGVVFAILAFTASYLNLREQLLLEAIGWMVSFVIPGHILFHKINKNK